MDDLWVGFASQWREASTWIAVAVASGVATLAVAYLHRFRRWPLVPTSLAFGWACLFFAATWRLDEGPRASVGMDGVRQFAASIGSVREWEFAAAYVAGGDPFVVANTVVLVPFGFFLTRAARRVWVTLLVAAALVLGAEALQAAAGGGDLHDVITNLVGAGAGAAAAGAYQRYRRRPAVPPATRPAAEEQDSPLP